MNKFPCFRHCPFQILGALEENLFDDDYECDDCNMIPVIVNIVVRVLLINPVTKRLCRRCRPRNIPSGRKKKNRKRRAESQNQQRQIMANAISFIDVYIRNTDTKSVVMKSFNKDEISTRVVFSSFSGYIILYSAITILTMDVV